MIEEAFKIELRKLNASETLVGELWSEIESHYTGSSRYYHNLSHLDHLVETLLPIKSEIEDWRIIIFSVAYHDLIYNPLRKDNEVKSADVAFKRLTQLNLPLLLRDKCKMQIIATKDHQVNKDTDTNYFTDADLAILGTNKESYLLYTRLIRKEYSYFPDLLYKPGRRKVLKHFLEMESIFKTKYFQDKYEDQARMNISAELKSLS
jgi:predicted metal-dependent HD superfamily phosphohydrolase